jgi:hypothetical protein
VRLEYLLFRDYSISCFVTDIGYCPSFLFASDFFLLVPWTSTVSVGNSDGNN